MNPAVWTVLLFYLGLGALLTAEEAGVFLLPGDISLIAAGVYAAQGGSVIFVSWAIASIGMVAGASIMFFSVRRHDASSRALPVRVRRLIRRFGPWGVGIARLVPGLRNATVFAAAAASLSPARFMMGLIPAAVVWSGLLLWVGYFGGQNILSAAGQLEGAAPLKIASIALIVAAAVFWLIRTRLSVRAETVEISGE